MLNETNASLAGTASPINWNLIGIIIAILSLFVAIIALYPSFAADRREKKKDRKNKLEEKLEKFYTKLKNALLKIDIKKILELNERVVKDDNRCYALYELNQIWGSFLEGYNEVKDETNRCASDEAKVNIDKFTNIVISNRLFSTKFTEKYESAFSHHNIPAYIINECINEGLHEKYILAAKNISDYYNDALSAIEQDIKSINEELKKLD